MIDNAIRKEVYDGDGSTVEWAIPFDYSDTEQVKLYTITDNVETEITTNFSINNNVITYPVNGAPVPEGTKVLVIRKTPLKQLESSAETPFTSADVERALDKLTCEVQEVKEDVDRALKSPEWSKESAGDLLKQVEQKVETLESVVSTKQDTLVSGTNIKTVNNQSLLGSGNIAINTDGYLPKVFDGEQVISPKTAGRYNSIVFDSKDGRCKFEIRKTLTGFALYTYKKINDHWEVVSDISSDVENFHSLKCSYSENGKICRIDVTEDGFKVDHYKDGEHADFDINCHTGATFNGKRILTEADKGVSGGVASLDANAKVPLSQLPDDIGGTSTIPAFPAPSEQISSESYTEALGYQHFENKSISSITFQSEPDNLFKTGVVDGTKTLSFKLGGIWDIILNFTVENGAVTYASLEAQKDGVNSGQFNFIEGGQYLASDTNTWLDGFQVCFDSTNRAIYADFDLKSNGISALADFTDESISFMLKEAINPLPSASDYANQLAYIYEEGEYSDIKNLIYSDGTSWQFLPGAVLQIPGERMKAASIFETPSYCGVELKTGQLAIPARNKNDMAPYYTVGQMHEFYLDAANPINRYWSALMFGTNFVQTMNELAQTSDEEAVWLWPQSYTETTFVNKSETIHTQNIKLFLTNQYIYCNFIFCQGTNKIKLAFQEKSEGDKIFYNGTDITAQSELVIDTDAKTVIGKIYSNNYNDCILELYDLPASKDTAEGAAADYVIERGTDENGNHYCLYKSGWLEQGGTSTTGAIVTYPKPYNSAPLVTTGCVGENDTVLTINSPTAKGFSTTGRNTGESGASFSYYWRACGFLKTAQTLFNMPLTADFTDAENKQSIGFYNSSVSNTSVEASQGYSFEDLRGSGAACGIIDNNYAYARLSNTDAVLIGDEDFSISADVYIPTPTNEYYRIPINFFTVSGYIPNNTYRAFTFGAYISKWYTTSVTFGIGYRYSTSATVQKDIYSAVENLSTTDVFDKWITAKLERKNGVTKGYFAGQEVDFTGLQPNAYSIQTFDEYQMTTVCVANAQDVSSFGATLAGGWKIKNLKMIKG